MNLKGKLYRIMTEDINRKAVLKMADKHFTGYTVRPGIGYWEGKPEKSITLEIITEDGKAVMKLANEIKVHNKQDAVLVESLSNHAELI